MTTQEREAVALIAIMAALVDGKKSDAERERIRELTQVLELDSTASLVPQVLMRKVSVESLASRLTEPDAKTLAFEMAVCVCDAEGGRGPEETRFLEQLASLLGQEPLTTNSYVEQADTLARPTALPSAYQQALEQAQAIESGTAQGISPHFAQELAEQRRALDAPLQHLPASVPADAHEQTIRNASILAGALELLPQSMATLAIIPVQTHLVFRIGNAYGYRLDAGHIKEFLAVIGIGLTSQALEGLGRKFLGNLGRKLGGKLVGGIVSNIASPVMTFATTYALGKLAVTYYSGGRTLSPAALQETFQRLLAPAVELGQSLNFQMHNRARTLNPGELVQLARKGYWY